MGLHLSKCQIVGNLMSRLISNTRIPEDDSSVERKSSLDMRAVPQNFVVLTSLTPITSVKSGNFGHQVNSDSDHVCFK